MFKGHKGKDDHKFMMMTVQVPSEQTDLTQWVREATVLAEQLNALARFTRELISEAVPVLMTSDNPAVDMLDLLVSALGELNTRGLGILAYNGVRPLELSERLEAAAKELLEHPELPERMRKRLTKLLQSSKDGDWPEFIGGEM